MTQVLGEHFARALAARDEAGLTGLLADSIDFQALTPGRSWEAATPRQVADILVGQWFAPSRPVRQVCSVSTGAVGDRKHVSYRLLVNDGGTDYLVEQQAYYNDDGGQITWLRILCSGFQQAAPSPR